jgi:hypothetical protein
MPIIIRLLAAESIFLMKYSGYHQLYHARKLVKNVRKAWETKKVIHDDVLSPSRVQRGMGDLLNQLPCIVEEVKPRGKSTGNRPGAKIITRADRGVVKKTSPKPIDKRGVSINYRFEKNSTFLKPRIKYSGIEKASIPTEIAAVINKIQKMPLLEALIPP